MFPSPRPSFNFSTRLWINLVAITWGVFGTEVNFLHSLEAGLDDIVHLQSRDHDVEAPEEDKEGRRDGLEELGSSELSADGRVSPREQNEDGEAGLDTEDGHGEAQAAHGHDELHGLASDGVGLGGPVESGHGPCDADTQEHVDSVGAGDVSDGVVGAVVLNGGGLGGEGVRDAGAKSNKCNGINAVFEVDEAAKMASNITNDSSAGADESN